MCENFVKSVCKLCSNFDKAVNNCKFPNCCHKMFSVKMYLKDTHCAGPFRFNYNIPNTKNSEDSSSFLHQVREHAKEHGMKPKDFPEFFSRKKKKYNTYGTCTIDGSGSSSDGDSDSSDSSDSSSDSSSTLSSSTHESQSALSPHA